MNIKIAGIKCPLCGSHGNKVIDSRVREDDIVSRTRKCECGVRIYTEERPLRHLNKLEDTIKDLRRQIHRLSREDLE